MAGGQAAKHPLLDRPLASSLPRFRVRLELKMRGFFHWLRWQAKQATSTLPPRRERPAEELRELTDRLDITPWRVTALAALPDGRLALGCSDGAVRERGLHGGSRVLLRQAGAVTALAALPGGRLALAREGGAISVWDLTSGREEELWGDTSGEDMETGHGYDRLLPLIDAAKNNCVLKGARARGDKLWESVLPVATLAALPDGRLASAGDDGATRIWDLATGNHHVLVSHDHATQVLDALDAQLALIVPAVGTPSEPHDRGEPCPLVLVQECDNSRTVGLLVDGLADGADEQNCRAFLFDPEGVAHLAYALRQGPSLPVLAEPPDAGFPPVPPADISAVLARAFDPATVSSHPRVAAVLSAAAQIDGWWSSARRAWQFERLSVPEDADAFPPRDQPLYLALLFH